MNRYPAINEAKRLYRVVRDFDAVFFNASEFERDEASFEEPVTMVIATLLRADLSKSYTLQGQAIVIFLRQDIEFMADQKIFLNSTEIVN